MFIDIHGHVYGGRRPFPPQGGGTTNFCTPDEILQRYDELKIDLGVMLPLIGPETYLPQSNEDILDICDDSNGRFLPFCNIDPRGLGNSPEAPLALWLRHYKEQGCKGIGEVMPNLPFCDPRSQNLFKHVRDVGFPLIFDISWYIGGSYGFYDDVGLPQLDYTLSRFPELIILGHGPPFWAQIAQLEPPNDHTGYPKYPVNKEGVVPELMRKHPNLYGDLSAGSGYNALARDEEYAVKFLNEFQDKLLFGTDICSFSQEILLPEFLLRLKSQGKISQVVFNKIARENAIELLGL